MKYFFLSFTFILAVVHTQNIPEQIGQLPGCSVKCLTDAIAEAKCMAPDYKCQCGLKKDEIQTQATPCVQRACSRTDYDSTSLPASN